MAEVEEPSLLQVLELVEQGAGLEIGVAHLGLVAGLVIFSNWRGGDRELQRGFNDEGGETRNGRMKKAQGVTFSLDFSAEEELLGREEVLPRVGMDARAESFVALDKGSLQPPSVARDIGTSVATR